MEYDYRWSPLFIDGCNHSQVGDVYHGSVRAWPDGEWVDVRTYPSPYIATGNCGRNCCLRYGNKAEQYYSPGPVENLVTGANCKGISTYSAALHLLSWKVELMCAKETRDEHNNT